LSLCSIVAFCPALIVISFFVPILTLTVYLSSKSLSIFFFTYVRLALVVCDIEIADEIYEISTVLNILKTLFKAKNNYNLYTVHYFEIKCLISS